MTYKVFLRKVQEYYGKYPAGQIRLIAYYLSKKSQAYLSKLFEKVIYGYSSKWGRPPDIAIFEEYKNDVLDELASKSKKMLPEYPDPRIQQQVAEMLHEFSQKLTQRR